MSSRFTLPECPYCNHVLSVGDVSRINVALRSDRLTGIKRKKPRVREVMPLIFNLLRDGAVHGSRDLFRSATEELAKCGFEEKRLATNFSLTWLSREGLVRKVRHGFWEITTEGRLLGEMTEEKATELERKYDPALSSRR